MTEAEWMKCDDPRQILVFLGDNANERKLRLFACACCRLIPGYLESEPDRKGLELTELDVDGNVLEEAFSLIGDEQWDIRWYRRYGWDAVWRALESYRCELETLENRPLVSQLRDIFGNPFRLGIFNPAWQTSNVVSLAQAIYDERAFDHMPILADALEDAGCTSADILNHCRTPGVHVRGCWVVDLVLAKV